MRVGIELIQLVPGISGGIVPFWAGALHELFPMAPEIEFYVYGTDCLQELLPEVPHNVHCRTFNGHERLKEMDYQLQRDRVEILLRCFPLDHHLFFPAERQIFLIPDVQHEVFPQFFEPDELARRRSAFNYASQNSAAVGVISEATRAELLSVYPETEGKIFLMPPALSRASIQPQASLSSEDLSQIPDQPYFLFPANLWPHKNHRRLFMALRRFNQLSPQQHALVLTGHPGGWEELKSATDEEPIFHLGFVREPLLRELFRRSRALTYFSLYEGFGIPLLEAFEHGVPVVCSNNSSLPEVGGNAVQTCDPTDVDAMAELMLQVVQNRSLRQSLIEQGKQRLIEYSWTSSASIMLDVLRQLHERLPALEASLSSAGFWGWATWWRKKNGTRKHPIHQHYLRQQQDRAA